MQTVLPIHEHDDCDVLDAMSGWCAAAVAWQRIRVPVSQAERRVRGVVGAARDSHDFKIKYYKCSNSKDLNLCFSKIRRTKKPIFIDVKLKKDEILLPKVSAVLKGEKIFSLPLEDMSPLLSLNELKSNLIGKLNINSIKIRKKNC